MSVKTFDLESIGKVTVSKRRNNRRMNLSVSAQGIVKISIPTWMPYQAGVNFARSKEDWIKAHHTAQPMFSSGQKFSSGKVIAFNPDPALEKPRYKVVENGIIVSYPSTSAVNNPEVQITAQKAIIKVLRQQAESLLPIRINELSKILNLPYAELKIKRLSRRWGSCDRNHNIVLNLYLIQLPDELIDYVICHELTHTRFLNHGMDFWDALKQISPNYKQSKIRLRSYSPNIILSL